MSPASALAFAAIGGTLFLLPLPRWKIAALTGALVTLVIGGVSAIGYGWNASELTTDAVLPPVALNTALAFIFLAAGALLALLSAPRRSAGNAGGSVPEGPLTMGSVEGSILVGFAGSFLLLAVGGGLSYHASAEFADSARLVARTQQVRAALSRLRSDLIYAGWTQRNYLITGQPLQLENYRNSFDRITADGRLLGVLIIDAGQRERLAALEPMLDRELLAMNQLVLLYQRRGFEAAKEQVDTGSGMALMGNILAAEKLDRFIDAQAARRGAGEPQSVP